MSGVIRRRHLLVLWVLAFAVLGVLGLGIHSTVMAVEDFEGKMEQSNLFLEVMTTIEQSYIDEEKTKPSALIENAIRGMVTGLDHYSVFLMPQEAKEFNDQTQGQFEGLGIQINIVNGWLTVVQPLVGTPAERAGLKPQDRIVKIEGESTKGISLPEAVKKLKGPRGSKVTITIARKGELELITKSIERDTINPQAIIDPKMLDDEVGYLRLQDFTKDAARELERQIRKMEAQGLKALILDLRDNHGGLLEVAVDVCDLFLDRGKVIVTHRGRGEDTKPYVSRRRPIGDFLFAILVNEYSASASEIVAGCMQDYGRAVIVGSAGSLRDGKPSGGKTFGKGSVQTLIPLSTKGGQGAMLKLTTAKYYTPKERSIEDMGGVTPDILANVTPDEHYSIRFFRRYGYLPPSALGSIDAEETESAGSIEEPEVQEPAAPKPDDQQEEEPSSEEKVTPEEEVTPEEVFKQSGESEQEQQIYDTELLTAYQALKASLILSQAGESKVARSRN